MLDLIPEMVVVPTGTFLMGSPNDEPGRLDVEGPQLITIAKPFAVGKFAVTVDQFAAFVAHISYPVAPTCKHGTARNRMSGQGRSAAPASHGHANIQGRA